MRSLVFLCLRCGREVIALGHETLPIRRICLLCEWADERKRDND